jgi:hypothetical protein
MSTGFCSSLRTPQLYRGNCLGLTWDRVQVCRFSWPYVMLSSGPRFLKQCYKMKQKHRYRDESNLKGKHLVLTHQKMEAKSTVVLKERIALSHSWTENSTLPHWRVSKWSLKPYQWSKQWALLLPMHQQNICYGCICGILQNMNEGNFTFDYKWATSAVMLHVRNEVTTCTSLIGCRVPITVTARSKALTVLARSDSGIVSSNPTRSMDVCVRLFCLLCPMCR